MTQVSTFREENVTYQSDTIQLAGTLFLPITDQPCRAVVCVHGSGPETRAGCRSLGEMFALHGIAALTYDKRGTGSSMGNWRKDHWSFEDLATDALAGVHFLKQRPEIDATHVGIWGISEGGWVTPLAASLSYDIDFLIPVSAAGMSPLEQERYRRGIVARDTSHSALEQRWKEMQTQILFALLRLPFLKRFPGITGFSARTFNYDTVPAWKKLTQPVLAIWGDQDKSVPPHQSYAIVEQALQGSGHPNYTLLLLPKGDHGLGCMQENAEGQPAWAHVPDYEQTMVNWILALK